MVGGRDAGTRLSGAERELLALLARLPLIPADALARLAGDRWPTGLRRRLARLEAHGRAAAPRPPAGEGRSRRLWHLTDRGLTALGRDRGRDPAALARLGGTTRAGLDAALASLPAHLGLYDLAAALAATGPGRARLLGWRRPWRGQYHRPRSGGPATVSLPAYLALAWRPIGEDGAAADAARPWYEPCPPAPALPDPCADFLLLPDRGALLPARWRPALRQLQAHRAGLARAGQRPPLLVVAAPAARRGLWLAALAEVAPLAALVAAWEDLDGGLAALAAAVLAGPPPFDPTGRGAADLLAGDPIRSPAGRRRPPAPLSADRRAAPATVGAPAGDERALLDLVARHPFLPREGLAAALGWDEGRLRRARRRLLERGLARLVAAGEPRLVRRGERAAVAPEGALDPAAGRGTPVGAVLAGRELLEATGRGLAAVAAWAGVPLSTAVRVNGLVGGGPAAPLGSRDGLLAALEHTLGVDGFFLALMRAGRRATAAGGDAALVEWRNAAVCARRGFRPDGYGIYRRDGALHAFLLEYDRDTMGRRDLRQKFGAYYRYRDGGAYRRDYDGFPRLLIVAATAAAEDRIARVLRDLAAGRPPLEALLTTPARLTADRLGPFGRVWRDPRGGARQAWLDDHPPRAAPGDAAARPAWQPRLKRDGVPRERGGLEDRAGLGRLMRRSPDHH